MITFRKTTVFYCWTKSVLFIVSFLIGMPLLSQIPENSNRTKLSKAQLAEEYQVLYTSIVNYHPHPFMYNSEFEFHDFVSRKIASFPDSMSIQDFHLETRELIAFLKCGHTFAKPSIEWYDSVNGKNISLPFDIDQIGEKVFISNTIDQPFEFDKYDELVSIAGRPIQAILNRMATIQERDGTTEAFVKEQILTRFRIYYLFIYGIEETVQVTFKDKDGALKTTSVQPTNQRLKPVDKVELPANLNLILENDWSRLACDSVSKIAYLQIKSFGDRSSYKAYYTSVFSEIKRLECTELLIDVRDNSGGFFHNGNELLRHLTSEKFEYNFERPKRKITKNKNVKLKFYNRATKFAFAMKPKKHRTKGVKTYTFEYKPHKIQFDGGVNVLTNGKTFSLAAVVCSSLKADQANFYGSETGGTEDGTNAMLQYNLTLPYSGIQISIPYYRIVSNSRNADFGRGIQPTVEIVPEDIDTTDRVLNETLENIIAKKQ